MLRSYILSTRRLFCEIQNSKTDKNKSKVSTVTAFTLMGLFNRRKSEQHTNKGFLYLLHGQRVKKVKLFLMRISKPIC